VVLYYRKRGEVWHCRGKVRVGRQSFEVSEFSTGCRTKAEAEAVGEAEEARIRAEVLDTGTLTRPQRKVSIGECIDAYKARPGSPHPFDAVRLDELNP